MEKQVAKQRYRIWWNPPTEFIVITRICFIRPKTELRLGYLYYNVAHGYYINLLPNRSFNNGG